jgi:hypothetical protein
MNRERSKWPPGHGIFDRLVCHGCLSGPFHKYAHVRCAQFGLGQGATRKHPSKVGL